MLEIIIGVLIPFLGTTLGAALVFFMKKNINLKIEKILLGFASGVMIAASIWSLIVPSIDMSQDLGKFSFVPAAIGFILGILFLLILDSVVPHLHMDSDKPEGVKSNFKKTTMMLLAVTLHNIPEGMAIGAVFAGFISGNVSISLAGAVALSIGIAIQNLPEGAIVSLPLKSEGFTKKKSFLYGVISGVVEPIAALLTIAFSSILVPILPYLLAFAAGSMIYVVVEELIPESQQGEHTNLATVSLAIGFVLMMILDVALG